ncbi:kinase-like domain-containing protein [Suillus paluster]|uniref:kinase-like domain-containing protein n=1 Tax=Suillus paluster TaxID=48578 RepID=UPI001B870E52|nr:kinase-like domain-containing protein [Suillus paluster]KAG1722216.1 kinase-like domain-containing protein [Suillus paluster]
MSEDLEQQISILRKSRWVNLSGLIDCATKRLSKPTCRSIQLLGNGSYNTVYKLIFADGTEIAASVSVHDDEDFNPQAKLSEIATMQFVRASGLYPDILVPQVHAWDITFSNPVGAPYVLMDIVRGRKLENLNNNDNLRGLDSMSEVQQLTVTTTLAKLQSALSAPVSFGKIGSITLNDEGSFVVGPLFSITQKNLGGPYKSLADLWRARLEHEILHAMRDWIRLETNQLSQSLSEPKCTPQKFSELFQLLSSLTPHFVPPSSYLPLVLHHPDLALRNVFFDPTDDTKIVGLIDWGGAQILPLILTAKFPGDLNSTGDDPCERQGIPDEGWNTVPHDWTSFGDTSKWPKVFRGANDQVDLTIRASAMVRRYYLRQHFGARFALENHDRYSDYDTGRAMLFAHAPYYLKFHEIIAGGWTAWVDHAEWIRETFRRLSAVRKDPRGHALIVGPNVYRSSMEKPVFDLSIFEEQSSEDDQDGEEEKMGE